MFTITNYLIGAVFTFFFLGSFDTDFKTSYFEGAERMLPQTTEEQRQFAYRGTLIIASILWFFYLPYRLIRMIVKSTKR